MECPMLILALAALLALAGRAAEADELSLFDFCRTVDAHMRLNENGWKDAATAYETAMLEVRSLANRVQPERKRLAEAWRAVTLDEPCGPKALTHVRTIHACNPRASPTQKFLYRDVRKYAKKCITLDYVETKFLQQKRDKSGLKDFLTDEVLDAYRRANPFDPVLYFTSGLDCCAPMKAQAPLAAVIKAKFPRDAPQFFIKKEKTFKAMSKLLAVHLYRQCGSYMRRNVKLMDGILAAAYYVRYDNLERLSQPLQDAIFRYKFCKNLEGERERIRFEHLLVNAFW